MAGVRIRESEPIESAIRRFKKQCEKAGILAELRQREHFARPSVRRKNNARLPRKDSCAERFAVDRVGCSMCQG
jgi:small subunit ribosomal protein S21